MDSIFTWLYMMRGGIIQSTLFLFIALLIACLCWRQNQTSGIRVAIATTAAWLSVILAYDTAHYPALWEAPWGWLRFATFPFAMGSAHLDREIFELQQAAYHAVFGLSGWVEDVRRMPWPISTALASVLPMAIALLTAFAVRPLVSSMLHQRLQRWLPRWARPLATNAWPEPPAGWTANAAILLLCLVPSLVIGPIAAIYLRLKHPALIWPLTWVAVIIALAVMIAPWLLSAFMLTGLLSLFEQLGEKNVFFIGFALIVPAISVFLLAATVPPSQRAMAARLCYILLILMCLPSVVSRIITFLHGVSLVNGS